MWAYALSCPTNGGEVLTVTDHTGSRVTIAAATARRTIDRLAAGERRSHMKGDELFCEGEPAEFFYRVVRGTVRTSKLLSDARRQIDSFHFEGDIFGFENAEDYSYSAEAVEDTIVMAYRRSSFRTLASDDPSLAEQVMAAMVASLRRAREHMLLLGRKTTQEKIAMFQRAIHRRLQKGHRLDLPMRRADIADYLGLTKETVSRTLTQMSRERLITLEAIGRTILLNDKAGLRRLNA